jgi:hypothetical protein
MKKFKLFEVEPVKTYALGTGLQNLTNKIRNKIHNSVLVGRCEDLSDATKLYSAIDEDDVENLGACLVQIEKSTAIM